MKIRSSSHAMILLPLIFNDLLCNSYKGILIACFMTYKEFFSKSVLAIPQSPLTLLSSTIVNIMRKTPCIQCLPLPLVVSLLIFVSFHPRKRRAGSMSS